jgi:hypothetical protein
MSEPDRVSEPDGLPCQSPHPCLFGDFVWFCLFDGFVWFLLTCTPGSIHLGAWPTRKGFPKTIKTDFINGDDLVPLQSSLRGEIWGAEMDKLGKRLVHKGYLNQPHANCFPGVASGVGDVFLSLSLCMFCHFLVNCAKCDRFILHDDCHWSRYHRARSNRGCFASLVLHRVVKSARARLQFCSLAVLLACSVARL